MDYQDSTSSIGSHDGFSKLIQHVKGLSRMDIPCSHLTNIATRGLPNTSAGISFLFLVGDDLATK